MEEEDKGGGDKYFLLSAFSSQFQEDPSRSGQKF